MSLLDDGTPALGSTEGPGPTERGSGRVARALLAERLVALLCLAVSLYIGLRAESLVTQSSIARPGALPAHGVLWLGAVVLGLASCAWAVQAFRRREAVQVPDLGRFGDVLTVFVMLAVGAWAAQWFGLLLASGVTYAALLLYYRDQNKIFILGSAVAYMAFLHYGLEVLLAVPLPRSPIFSLPF